jgi:uncharacterized protein
MNNPHISMISMSLSLKNWQVENVLDLFSGGATVPFVSRYRKEATGSLDEVQIEAIQKQSQQLKEVDKRRKFILQSVEEQGVLTDELRKKLTTSYSLTELEDLYLPHKPKRKTRASVARERGLEVLAKIIMKQQDQQVLNRARQFVKGEVTDAEAALQGARDIVAEWVSENQISRTQVRRNFSRSAMITSKVVKDKERAGEKYKDYFKYSEKLSRCPSHRMLALRRGEEEGFLRLSIGPENADVVYNLQRIFVKGKGEASTQVELAVTDAYKRLLAPSISTEFRNQGKETADDGAIKVFANNLRQLLLASPIGQKRTLAIDPGFKSGCKVVCLDAQGNLKHNETIFPHPPQKDADKAMKKISQLVEMHKIEAIAIGNGTAGRETEQLIKRMRFNTDVLVFIVNEAGASIYSASAIAREEFPQFDVTVRGAISIGRRLMDPLAELVKIDAKSIGVGQYQHDVDQKKLQGTLDRVVESCVNAVGVNLNTASKHLLAYVAGLGPQLAQNIVDYRAENGAFTSRLQVKKVARMGGRTWEQCVGFLRIPNAKNPLDNSAVHPERYAIVQRMAKDCKSTVVELISDEQHRKGIDLERYVTDEVGMPTLKDILQELEKPGRDPRAKARVFEFDSNVSSIDDLREGMELPGIVTNITNFGCFVDVGVKQDGLVHVSQLANRFVSDPNEVVTLNQHVKVRVVEVDKGRKRIQLSMKAAEEG